MTMGMVEVTRRHTAMPGILSGKVDLTLHPEFTTTRVNLTQRFNAWTLSQLSRSRFRYTMH